MDIFHDWEMGENGDVFVWDAFDLMVIQMGSLLIFVRKPISISNLRLATKRRELETSIYSEKEYIHVSIIKTYTHFPNELCF